MLKLNSYQQLIRSLTGSGAAALCLLIPARSDLPKATKTSGGGAASSKAKKRKKQQAATEDSEDGNDGANIDGDAGSQEGKCIHMCQPGKGVFAAERKRANMACLHGWSGSK